MASPREVPHSEHVPFVAVASVQGAWGLGGHVRVALLTDFPERLAAREQLYLGQSFRPVYVEEFAIHGRSAVLKLREVDSPERAAGLRGQVLYIGDDDLAPLPEGTYYWHQIIGLEVRTTDGRSIGRVVEILRTGSNDVYVVREGEREVLVPAIESVVRSIDVRAGLLVIEALPGML
ncbi:MAG: 16S rRNA processing protein RimM [Chloroflexi bacterium]|nr:16S rRNA processing protein RimM [Chloroflexota bacterium]